MKTKIKRAAIYCHGENLAYQAGVAAAFIIDKGLSLANLYVDNLHSLTNGCDNDSFDAIIVRNMSSLPEIELPLPVICAETQYCTDINLNPETLRYKKPKYSKEPEDEHDISEAVLEVLCRRRQKHIMGMLPFGCFRRNGNLLPDPVTAPVVEKIFIKAEDGQKLTAIAAWLRQERILNSGGRTRWNDSTIRNILRNKNYVNTIVTQELFDAVQERFVSRNSVKTSTQPQGVYQRHVFCGVCDRAMQYHGIDEHRKASLYFCKFHTGLNPKGKPLAHSPMIYEEDLKQEVLKRCNDHIEHTSIADLDNAIKKLENKKNSLECKMQTAGEKLLRRGNLSNVKCSGLWTSWNAVRNKYNASCSYRSAIEICKREKHIDEQDYDMELELIHSITVSPKGKISVRFLDDFLF